MNVMTWMRRGLCAALAVCMVACGGDGSESADQPPAATADTAPAITTPPAAASVTQGQAATFTVVASGSAPLAYQWLRDGVAIPGATEATYSLVPTLADTGAALTVQVSNGVASVTSASALLTVTAPAAITIVTPPQATAAVAGATATFSVVAQAPAAGAVLAYQWQRDGSPIAGATEASHTTAALTLADDGARYAVLVSSGSAAPVQSAEAVLTVTAAASALAVVPHRLAVGNGYALAVRADGSVLAWGTQMPGGPGAAVAGTLAHVVDGVAQAGAVLATSATGPAYAVRGDGALLGWGNGADGTLGVAFAAGASTLVQAPVVVPQVSRIVQFNGTLALDADGALWAFPARASTAAITAARVPGIGRVVALGRASNGSQHTAIDASGKAFMVDVFLNTAPASFTVTELGGWPRLVQLECLGRCLGVDSDGNVWGSGNNFYGQVGDGTNVDKALPVRITALGAVKSVSVSLNYSFAITRSGQVYSWGDYFMNGRDDRIASNVPRLVPGLADAEELVIGGNINCLVRLADGSVWGWGYNPNGELGTAATAASFVPVRAQGINLN